MAKLLYGSGLRLMDCLRLRVKGLDSAQRQIIVRDGKGQKDRATMLPEALIVPLREHLARVRRLHEEDLAKGYGSMFLPFALERKYPDADKEWIWQYVFPSDRLSADPRSDVLAVQGESIATCWTQKETGAHAGAPLLAKRQRASEWARNRASAGATERTRRSVSV